MKNYSLKKVREIANSMLAFVVCFVIAFSVMGVAVAAAHDSHSGAGELLAFMVCVVGLFFIGSFGLAVWQNIAEVMKKEAVRLR